MKNKMQWKKNYLIEDKLFSRHYLNLVLTGQNASIYYQNNE
jgi:hypothetical protein